MARRQDSVAATTTTVHSWKLVKFDVVYLETCECLMLMLCILELVRINIFCGIENFENILCELDMFRATGWMTVDFFSFQADRAVDVF